MDYNNWNQQNQNPNHQYNQNYNQNYNQSPNGNQGGNPYNNPYPGSPYPQPRKTPASGLVNAAFILGIAAIVSAFMMTVYFPFILGGISIVLALLSKGYDNKMAGSAKAGIVCSVIGLVVNILIVSVSFHTLFTDERVFQQFDSLYEQIYGDSFTDTYKEMTGEDFPIPR